MADLLQDQGREIAAGRRARDPHAKDERRSAILRAAADLFDDLDFDDLSMAMIAQRAGLAKGTLYLYFRTKEELFLHLLLSRLADWFETLGIALDASTGPVEPAEVARIVATTLSPRGSLTRLLGIIHNTLERNIETAEAAVFVRRLLDLMTEAAERLERRVAGFPPGQGIRFLRFLRALVVGLSRSASLPPSVRQAIEDQNLSPFRIDFSQELEAGVTALLCGMVQTAAAERR
jgi:AcrR family transcriptional regulator